MEKQIFLHFFHSDLQPDFIYQDSKFRPRGILTRTQQLWARSPPVHSLSVPRLIDEGQVTMGTAFSLVKIFSKREQDIFYEFIKQKHSESFE